MNESISIFGALEYVKVIRQDRVQGGFLVVAPWNLLDAWPYEFMTLFRWDPLRISLPVSFKIVRA